MHYNYGWSVFFVVLLSPKFAFHAALSTNPKPKKIILLASNGGNGHMTACSILQDTLTDFDVKIVNSFDDVVHAFSILKFLTLGKIQSPDQFYNAALQGGWFRTINFLVQYPAPLIFHLNHNYYEKIFFAFLLREKPDLLISTVPVYNYPAACATHRYGIPFMIITLDADLSFWLHDLQKCTSYDMTITIGTKTPRLWKQLARKNFDKKNIHVVGHPIKKDFFEPKDIAKIRKEWGIPEGKPVAMLIRGGSGSSKLITYVRTLLNLDIPLHLLVCIGRNTSLIPKLAQLKGQRLVSFSVVPFTTHISDLMAISELLVTQPSPNVCNEAMQSKLPILVDMSGNCLFWERATIDWIKARRCGVVFKKMSSLAPLVRKYVGQKAHIQKTMLPAQNFQESIKKLINEILHNGKGLITPKIQTSAFRKKGLRN